MMSEGQRLEEVGATVMREAVRKELLRMGYGVADMGKLNDAVARAYEDARRIIAAAYAR